MAAMFVLSLDIKLQQKECRQKTWDNGIEGRRKGRVVVIYFPLSQVIIILNIPLRFSSVLDPVRCDKLRSNPARIRSDSDYSDDSDDSDHSDHSDHSDAPLYIKDDSLA